MFILLRIYFVDTLTFIKLLVGINHKTLKCLYKYFGLKIDVVVTIIKQFMFKLLICSIKSSFTFQTTDNKYIWFII